MRRQKKYSGLQAMSCWENSESHDQTARFVISLVSLVLIPRDSDCLHRSGMAAHAHIDCVCAGTCYGSWSHRFHRVLCRHSLHVNTVRRLVQQKRRKEITIGGSRSDRPDTRMSRGCLRRQRRNYHLVRSYFVLRGL